MKRLLKQPDFLGFSFLFLLVFLFLWQGTVAGKVLLPADTLYSFLPWEPYAASFGVGVPRNDLIADMVLQNYSWKELAKDSFLRGELPLWNPYVFTGVPFLAGGQAGVLYPIGLPLFTLLPTAQAYVWFIALHLLVGGLGTYVYLRAIDTGRWGALLAAVAFSLAGFLVVSFQWPQVVSAAVWLPVVLLCLEQLFKQVEERSLEGPAGVSSRWLGMPFWTLLGAVAVGLSLLAGHLEISFYLLFSVTAYALVRLALMLRELGPGWRLVKATAGAVLLVGLGCALAAVQLVPSYELLMENFRAGAATFGQVAGWALPGSQLLAFLMPDFFGNPTHHFYFDAIRGVDLPVVGSADLAGQLRSYPFWGLKNYVEGTAYLGLLPLILAGAALLLRRDRYTAFFAGYGLFALLLAFGTPLYALFFFGVPGFDQLHTPFRWLYPYSFCVIVLAGRGADALLSARPAGTQGAEQWCRRWLGPGVAFVGALVLIAAAFSRLGLPLSLGFASSLLDASAALQAAFPSPEMLYSYQLRNLFIFGMMLLLSGVALMLVRGAGTGMTSDRGPGGRGTHSFHPDPVEGRTGLAGGLPRPAARVIEFLRDKAGPVALLGVLTVDLVGFGWGLISFSDPRLMSFVPPALQWLQRDQEPYRIATYGSDDVLPPNSALLAGLHDVRGYESVIPRQYVEFWGLLEEPSQLLYNRLDRFTDPKALATPLLDLMNVKYVLTGQPLAQEGFTLVYQEEVFIYENQEVMPRAYAVFDAHDVGSELEARQLLSGRTADLRRTVVLQGAASESRRPASARPMQAARILHYGPNRVVVAVDMPQAGYLVLSDAFFPGWRAQDEGGRKLPVLRANAVFRAVALEPGHHTVTFTYFPDSLKLGLYISFLGGVLCLLTAAYWGWRRFYREAAETSVVRRVVKNSVTPMAGQVVARAVDFGFAIFMLRILGPTQYGGYAFAVVLIGYFAILTDFGLGTLLTREIARDPSQANRYVANSILIRLGLCVLSAPLLLAIAWLYFWRFALPADAVITAALFMISLVPSGIAGALSAVFSAHEKMEYQALVNVATTVLRATLGIVVLLLGWGIIGLGAVSIVASTVTALVFGVLVMRTFFRLHPEFEPAFGRSLVTTSAPLMLNNFLNTIFFRTDVMMLQPLRGMEAVGFYSTAYKFIDGLLIIPSFFTLALFPVLSRYAQTSHDLLMQAYVRTVKVLLLIALPLTVGVALIAEQLILLFFGEAYAPSVRALQILIWFLPFSYINGVTQYVLIAVNQQRYLTGAFLLGAGFNLLANLLVIPIYGIEGAAAVTVVSELVLMVPFMRGIYRYVGPLPLASIGVRGIAAAAVMGLLLFPLRHVSFLALAPLGACIYLAMLLLLRAFDEEDRRLLRRLFAR